MNPARLTSTAARSGGDASKFALHPGANEIYEGMIDLALRPAASWKGQSPGSANGRRPSLSRMRRSVGRDPTPFGSTKAPEEYDNNSRNNSRSNIKKDKVVDLLRDLVREVRRENDDDDISPPMKSNGREGGNKSSNNSMSSAALALMDLSSCNDLDSGASSAELISLSSGDTAEYDDFGEGGDVLPFPAPPPLAPPRRHSSLLPPRLPLRRYDGAVSIVDEEEPPDNGRAASPTSSVGGKWREVDLWGGEANSEEEGSPRTSPRSRCLVLKLNLQAPIGSIRLLNLPSASRLPGRFARSA